jgi:hypothetical protein
MVVCIEELTVFKDKSQRAMVEQIKKEWEMLAAHDSELQRSFQPYYGTDVKPICGNYLHEVAFQLQKPS